MAVRGLELMAARRAHLQAIEVEKGYSGHVGCLGHTYPSHECLAPDAHDWYRTEEFQDLRRAWFEKHKEESK